MDKMKLQIGGLYYVFNLNHVSGEVNYVDLCYYVGKGQYTQTLGFDMYPHNGDIFVPYGTEGIESARLNSDYWHPITTLKINPLNYIIKEGNYIDIQSESLNEFDWWNDFVKKYNLA